MKLLFTVLSLFTVATGLSQVTIRVLNQSDSNALADVVCTNMVTNSVTFSDQSGLLQVKKSNGYVLVHPSFYSMKIDNVRGDTVVYLQQLVRDIEEVEIVTMTNEKLFRSVIQKYRSDLSGSTRTGTLYYKNTNWFTYQYKEEQTADSASCAIENTLNFQFTEAKKKSEILFSPVSLARSCSSFSLPKNAEIKTDEIPGFSRFDFSHFLHALFTKGSYFDKIGFDHTQTTKKEDPKNKTIELKFLASGYEKTIVLSALDSSLISYQFRFISKSGSYHVYYATFSDQQVQTLYEEKGYLFQYENQNHLFNSVHFGSFNTDNVAQVKELKSFAEILKGQSNENSSSQIEPLYQRYRNYLIEK